jgi:hypothetical protein
MQLIKWEFFNVFNDVVTEKKLHPDILQGLNNIITQKHFRLTLNIILWNL